jgi:regulatory protein
MKITSIKQQTKNPERVSIFLDGKYSFSLTLDELVKYKLKNDDELDKADVKKYKKISEDGKLRARALEWLLNRPHSIREFKDYLYRKKAEPELTEKLIEEFSQKGYLDDVKFAVWFSELRGRKGKSDRALRAELFKKGIGREVVDEVIEQSVGDEASRLQILIDKKAKLPRYKADQQKLAQYLTSQGFSYSAVREALKINQPED